MNHYKIYLLFIALIFNNQVFAQESKPTILSKFTFSLNYKESILMSKTDFKTQSRDLFAGYRIGNSFVIGLNSGIYNEFNSKKNEFYCFNNYGLGFKYQFVFEKRHLNKEFMMEPYLIFNNAINKMNDDSYFFYDVGLNFIYPKAPYFYLGTGVRQNFYSDDTKRTIDWYYSFGLRF